MPDLMERKSTRRVENGAAQADQRKQQVRQLAINPVGVEKVTELVLARATTARL
jgi:hypothetical protein